MSYDSPLAGFGAGGLKLQRLTRLEGLACE